MGPLEAVATTVEVGPVASFRLVSREDGFRQKALRLREKIVVVRGTMSQAATQERRYARGSFLGHRQVVQVASLEPAGETTR